MAASSLRILHAIHDFLPQCQAGSEIYASDLCRALLDRGHHVTVVCATFDPLRPHGHVRWRVHEGIPVVEITNNWIGQGFEETYRDPVMRSRVESVLQAVQPDIVHVHNLMNLTFDLPGLAHARGARVVATLHDYTLVCPSGGQRIHKAEQHLCRTIEPERCARCFPESSFGERAAFGRLTRRQRFSAPLATAARAIRAVVPVASARASTYLRSFPVTADDIERRLDAARTVFREVDLFIAPSAALASEFMRLGLPEDRVRVSDYGFRSWDSASRGARSGHVRFGFVGTPVWHKGVHVLLDAAHHLVPDTFELTIFGDLSIFPDYAAELRARATGLPVRFAGVFPRADAERVYEQIDVLVVPSLWLENSPLVIHEALMAGIPIVASNIGGIADLIQHDRNGLLFEAGNPLELAGIMGRLVDEPALLDRLASAPTRVKTIDEDATEWEQVYDALAVRPSSAVAAL